MNVLDEFTQAVLRSLNASGVDYLVVGGYAVNFHGYRRTTGDIDLWLKPSNDNKIKVLSAFRELEVDEDILAQLDKYDFTKPIVLTDGEEPFKIDYLTKLSGVTFDEAWRNAIASDIDGLPLKFLHLNDLILAKMSAGRPKDKLDIDELQKIAVLRSKGLL